MVVPGTTVTSESSLSLSDTILTIKGPRPTSLYSTYACNGTTFSGYGHGCMMSTPSCEVTGMVTTMNVYGRYVIECTSSGSVTATSGTVEPSGIAVPTVSLHHTPLPTSGVTNSGVITSTFVVSSQVQSTITTTPAATATVAPNHAPRRSNASLGVPAVLVISLIGAFICSNIY